MSRLHIVTGTFHYQDADDKQQTKAVKAIIRSNSVGDAHIQAESETVRELLEEGIEDVYQYYLEAETELADESWYELSGPERLAKIQQLLLEKGESNAHNC